MAEPVATAAPAPAAAAAPAAQPTVAAAPAPAPAVEAPAPAPAAVEAAPATPAESVLSAASETLKPAEGDAATPLEAPKPDEAANPEEVKADEAKPSEPAAPPPPLTYTDLKFPEGATINDAELKPYTDIMGKHQIPQAAVQELIDLHAAQLTEQATRSHAAQLENWNSTRRGWVDEFVNDPEMGGKVRETTLSRAAGVIERYAGTAEQQQQLRDTLSLTGAGDHPALIRLLANVGKALGEGRIVPAVRTKATAQRSTPKSRYTAS